MDRPPQVIAEVYLTFLEQAITGLRMRIRYGEQVSLGEVHDLMDAIHNIPAMLRSAGEWFTEENIAADLTRYDQRWLGEPGSQLRSSLIENLHLIRARE